MQTYIISRINRNIVFKGIIFFIIVSVTSLKSQVPSVLNSEISPSNYKTKKLIIDSQGNNPVKNYVLPEKAEYISKSSVKNLFGRDSLNHQIVFPKGVTISYGLGSYSVCDEFISKEKYSGTFPYFTAKWSRFQMKGGYCLGLEFRSSDKIRNYNINTQIIQFSLYRDYFYRVGKFSLFSKHVYAFLGPTPEFYFYYNQPNISRNGLYLNLSFAAFFSLGCNGQFIMPLRQDLQVEGSFRMSLLSVGLRMVELVDRDVGTDQPPLKFLTPFSGLNSTANLGLRYYLLRSFSLKLAYKVQILRITPWDDLVSASDNLTASITYHF